MEKEIYRELLLNTLQCNEYKLDKLIELIRTYDIKIEYIETKLEYYLKEERYIEKIDIYFEIILDYILNKIINNLYKYIKENKLHQYKYYLDLYYIDTNSYFDYILKGVPKDVILRQYNIEELYNNDKYYSAVLESIKIYVLEEILNN